MVELNAFCDSKRHHTSLEYSTAVLPLDVPAGGLGVRRLVLSAGRLKNPFHLGEKFTPVVTCRPLVFATSPLLSCWYRDGLAALVISPTRELSLQIFEVLREFGKHHQLSAGLITGGKKEFREEQTSVIKMNILVATPGRLLQHLEQTPGFDPSLLQVGWMVTVLH